jgi:hypothetical protein
VFVVGLNVIPEGKKPDSEMLGAGEPVAVTVKDPGCPSVNVTVAALVNDAATVPLIENGTDKKVKPYR